MAKEGGKTKNNSKKQPAKKLPAAPLGPVGGPKVKKNSQFEKTPKSFRIGADLQPKRNLTRFVKWPQYIRLQRQKRILMQRVKVPPSLAQFQHTVDKTNFSQLARLLKKMTPETKAQKKDRLRDAAEGKAENKAPTVVKYGINHVTDLIENKKAKLVVIAHDVDPIELVVWMPALCRKKDVPYCIVKSKSRLGQFVGQKNAACLALTTVRKEDQKDLDVLCESFKASFNDNKEIQRRWGGGVMGMKSQHVEKAKALLIEKELAKKTGLMM